MKSTFTACFAAVTLFLAATVAHPAPQWGTGMAAAIPVPEPPSLSAPSYILVDMHSGYVLASRAADEQWEPASLVKMMTAYVVFNELKAGHINLDDEVPVSERAWRAPGSRMFIEVGSRVPVEKLLMGLIVQSGNDAAIALAEYVAGDEETFAQVMNQYANLLEMHKTHYANATGLPDPDMLTSAWDTARLARAIIEEFPEYYAWYSVRTYEYGGIRQHNRNRLLWRDESVDGVKTGHTQSAGYNLATSAQRDGMRLISVVLGTASEQDRAQQSHQLLNYGFRFFETHRLYRAGETLTEARAFKGDRETVALGVTDDLYVTIPRRQYDAVSASVSVNGHVVAPVSAGEELGRLRVQLQGETIHEAPLVALDNIDEGSLWRRLFDDVLLRFQ